MASYAVTAVVLHRHILGETDRIVRLLTRERGKVSAVAKGSRRPGSRLAGATEPFAHGRFLIAEGASLDILSQCDIAESFPVLRSDLQRLARAHYACEFADRLVEDRAPSAQLYDELLECLHVLQHPGVQPDMALSAYLMRTLADQGYAPELRRCVRCGAEPGTGAVAFSPAAGGTLCAACRAACTDAAPVPAPALAVIRQVAGADLAHLVGWDVPPSTTRHVCAWMARYVRHVVERDLKSSAFLEHVRVTG